MHESNTIGSTIVGLMTFCFCAAIALVPNLSAASNVAVGGQVILSEGWESSIVDTALWRSEGNGAGISSDGHTGDHSCYLGLNNVWGALSSVQGFSFGQLRPKIEFWVRTNGSGNYGNNIGVFLTDCENSSISYMGLFIRAEISLRQVQCYVNGQMYVAAYPIELDNAWHHLCMEIDESSKAIFTMDGNLMFTSDSINWESLGSWNVRLAGYTYFPMMPIMDDLSMVDLSEGSGNSSEVLLPFTMNLWEGRLWCGNLPAGSWSPTFECSDLIFKTTEVCWGQVRSVDTVLTKQEFSLDVSQRQNSIGVNPDQAIVAISDGWFGYEGGRSIGIGLMNDTIYLTNSAPGVAERRPVGNYERNSWLTLRLRLVSNSLLLVSGPGFSDSASIVGFSRPLRYLVACGDSDSGFAVNTPRVRWVETPTGSIVIYPIPVSRSATGVLTIAVNSAGANSVARLRIYNSGLALVDQKEYPAMSGLFQISYGVGSLAPGVYMLQLEQTDETGRVTTERGKFIVTQ